MLSELRWHCPSWGCTIPARRPSRATWVLASEVKIRRWEAPGRQPILSYFHIKLCKKTKQCRSVLTKGTKCLSYVYGTERAGTWIVSLHLAHSSLNDGIKASLRRISIPGHHLLSNFLCEPAHFLRQGQNVFVAKLGQAGCVDAVKQTEVKWSVEDLYELSSVHRFIYTPLGEKCVSPLMNQTIKLILWN